MSLVEFVPILWGLAGPLTVFGVTVPKALFWMALIYVFFTTVVAFWIGHPLIRLSFRNELTNAAFRYALVRLAMRPRLSASTAAKVPNVVS